MIIFTYSQQKKKFFFKTRYVYFPVNSSLLRKYMGFSKTSLMLGKSSQIAFTENKNNKTNNYNSGHNIKCIFLKDV